jgi:hypothetical protein
VKRLCADDSAATSVKVGHRQASYKKPPLNRAGVFALRARISLAPRSLLLYPQLPLWSSCRAD